MPPLITTTLLFFPLHLLTMPSNIVSANPYTCSPELWHHEKLLLQHIEIIFQKHYNDKFVYYFYDLNQSGRN